MALLRSSRARPTRDSVAAISSPLSLMDARSEEPRRRSTSFERSHSRQQPVDDFFLKPYVASPASARKAQDEAAAEAERKNTPRQPLAALLGGLGMPRRTPSES